MVKPNEVFVHPMGTLVNAIGKAELEFVGALIVYWHQVKKYTDWQPVSRRDLTELISTDEKAREWLCNPFWRPDVYGFSAEGYIDGWAPDEDRKGTLTEKFFACLNKATPTTPSSTPG